MKRKTNFSCPVNTCNICVCWEHFLDNTDVAQRRFLRAFESLPPAVDTENPSDEERVDVEPASIYDESRELCPEDSIELGHFTDAG